MPNLSITPSGKQDISASDNSLLGRDAGNALSSSPLKQSSTYEHCSRFYCQHSSRHFSLGEEPTSITQNTKNPTLREQNDKKSSKSIGITATLYCIGSNRAWISRAAVLVATFPVVTSKRKKLTRATCCNMSRDNFGTVFVALPSEISRFFGHARFMLVVVSFAGLLTLCCIAAWHAMLSKRETEEFCFGCNSGSSAIQSVGTLLHQHWFRCFDVNYVPMSCETLASFGCRKDNLVFLTVNFVVRIYECFYVYCVDVGQC